MLLYILIGLAVVVVAFLGIVASQPDHFRVERSTRISAPPERVFAEVNDFHQWHDWSPWAKLDPKVKNAFEGPSSGPGAIFRWDGDRKVGAGAMTILETQPGSFIKIQIDFLKPFVGTNTVEFTFKPEGDQTFVTWAMYGTQPFIGKAISMVMSCDKMIGGYYEKGLASLKAVSEARSKINLQENP